ncbi:HD domain-containing protein [Mycoplasmatota bacterium]|nr:HD domain-containing protein [Mycoplasmatota bacterium]
MRKNGLFIIENGSYKDKFTLTSNELKLLASADGVEIMTQSISEGVIFDVCPSDDNATTMMEFFYVLEGELEYIRSDNEKIKLGVGDCFYAHILQEVCIFNPLTDIKILYIATQPIFHELGESMRELHKLNYELQFKDQYTKSHSERVRELSLSLAIEMGLNRDIIAGVALAALFHDVGKIEIPSQILKKTGKLDEDEFEIIKRHSVTSSDLVRNIKYKDISQIVAEHHERFDGSGYPKGIAGKNICIEARIIAVADTYDAMMTDRPYRTKIEKSKVISEINELSGTKYDPQVVEAFNRLLIRNKI